MRVNIRWPDFRADGRFSTIRIDHHKTGKSVLHPLEEVTDSGEVIKFYEEAEDVLSHLPRLGISMILRKIKSKEDSQTWTATPYSIGGFQKIACRTEDTMPVHAGCVSPGWHDRA